MSNYYSECITDIVRIGNVFEFILIENFYRMCARMYISVSVKTLKFKRRVPIASECRAK